MRFGNCADGLGITSVIKHVTYSGRPIDSPESERQFLVRYFAYFIIAGWVCAGFSQAQEITASPSQQTTAPTTAQYEIVQSALTVADTFKLDRYVGAVQELVESPDKQLHWQPMVVEGIESDLKLGDTSGLPPPNPRFGRFQIFLSGITVKDSFLIDTRTGMTWILVVDDKGEKSWEILG